jgi:hypothetical protein
MRLIGLRQLRLGDDMNKTGPRDRKSTAERRSGSDRRKTDSALPAKHDRRRGLEARKPEVSEVEMSNSDWIALVGDDAAKSK